VKDLDLQNDTMNLYNHVDTEFLTFIEIQMYFWKPR